MLLDNFHVVILSGPSSGRKQTHEMRSEPFRDKAQSRVITLYQHCETTYRSHLQGSRYQRKQMIHKTLVCIIITKCNLYIKKTLASHTYAVSILIKDRKMKETVNKSAEPW
jgi:hypothetical protein